MRSQCQHEYQEFFYDPNIIKVPYGNKRVELGSDSYFESEGLRDEVHPRWTKVCKKCGYKKHATKKKPGRM